MCVIVVVLLLMVVGCLRVDSVIVVCVLLVSECCMSEVSFWLGLILSSRLLLLVSSVCMVWLNWIGLCRWFI